MASSRGTPGGRGGTGSRGPGARGAAAGRTGTGRRGTATPRPPAEPPRTGARRVPPPHPTGTGGQGGTGRSASRPASARRAAAPGSARRTAAPAPGRLTGRATALALVLGALLLAYAYPVRIYLNQQAQIESFQRQQEAQSRRIDDLRTESAKLNDPNYIIALARSRLQMGLPGEVLYVVVDTEHPAAPPGPDAGRVKNTGPWYGQLWSSIRAADKPRPTS